ncbi:MAG: glycosyltransferase family 4 protein [Verrucomicrobiota bacterium]|nr:glycosyltransferase family 4 protein [Verrucomicrobiota bacterium]
MKITIVLGAFFPVPTVMGGAVEKIWSALAREFATRGHAVTLISRAIPQFQKNEIVDGVRYLRVPGFDTPRSLLWLKFLDLIYSWRVRRVLPPADILVTNTFWLPLLARDRSQGKIYVHVGRYPKGQMWLYHRAARLQAPSRDIADAMGRRAARWKNKIVAIPYPRPSVSDASVVPIDQREKIVLFVGRVHPEKGVHLLIEAFAALHDSVLAGWKLVLVGPTETNAGGGGADYLHGLRQSASSMNGRVEFRGPIFDEQKLAQEFRAARIFAYPSLAARGETFGLAPLEAMTHGCAVIVSDLGCFRDFVTPDETGFVFPHDAADPAGELAKTLQRAVSTLEKLARVAAAGRLKSKDFSIERVADKFLADFASLK